MLADDSSLLFPSSIDRTYHFPDAFYGQNTKIRETLNNLILKSPQDWQTGVALPFVRIEGTTVEWDEYAAPATISPNVMSTTNRTPLLLHRLRFDVRLLQRVPYEGISRMQTSLRRRHRDRVVRRGSTFQLRTNAMPWSHAFRF